MIKMLDLMQKKYNLSEDINFSKLVGKFLIASPYQSFNEIFNRSIIYIASCNQDGATGLIINQQINNAPSTQLNNIFLEKKYNVDINIPIFLGGPVEPSKGFVIHSLEYQKNVLFQYEELAISSNTEIIKDINEGRGPEKTLFVLGYTYWYKGQMEEEINNNYWIFSDSCSDLVFSHDVKDKWQEALERVGIDYLMFSNSSGLS